MTSSSSYELALEQDGRIVLREAVSEIQVPYLARQRPTVRGGRQLLLTVRRISVKSHLRLRISGEVLVELSPGRREVQLDLSDHLSNEFGEVELAVEEASPENPEDWLAVLRAHVEVQARPGLEEMYDALVRELEEIHGGLARDILSRTTHRAALTAWSPRHIDPVEDLARLEEIGSRLDRALRRIGDQPSSALLLTRRRQRWRAGDRTDTRTASEIAGGGGTFLKRPKPRGGGPRPLALGKVLVRRTGVTHDIGEHRHLREGLLHLDRWTRGLVSTLRRRAGFLLTEEKRWGEEVFRERYQPRIRMLEELAARAARVAAGFRKTIARHEFLRDAGPPRTPFGPTPIFLGRDAYRDAYRALAEARRRFGVLVDEDDFRVRYRSFPVLYEYWCFIRVVKALRERLGAPEGRGGFSLIDEVYRPDLTPGQSFRFRLARRAWVGAIYEPEFPPVAVRRDGRFASALVTGPLRPDIIVEVSWEDRPPVMLALDSKSTRSFSRADLWKLSDYRALIHDPVTGHQPVRQLFLLHADRNAAPVSNLTGYLEGLVTPRDASVLGAVPCLPGETQHLERVLERFLELWAPT